MSTKTTIKYEHDADSRSGYHLYTEWYDELEENEVVHLELNGVAFDANSGGTVSVAIPIAWAKKLGLIAN